MAYMKSPFNFIEISDKTYNPDWSEQISHDIPFSDGVSGVINLEIKAHTPIFIRNGHTKKDAEAKNAVYRSFSNIENRYFIPATSIKGEVRNILEILSFSKMEVDQRSLFAQREWTNTELYSIKGNQTEILCGWLRRKGEDYEIINCGKPYRISHKNIDDYIGHNLMESNFSKKNGIDLNKEKDGCDPKTAIYKYHLIEKNGINLNNLTFVVDEEHCNQYNPRKVFVSKSGNIHGTIVLTGQPDKWDEREEELDDKIGKTKKPTGKYYEFVFADCEEVKVKSFSLSKETFAHYKFIYQDSAEWKRIKENIETKQGVPVFFRVDGTKIKDFGMAYLYKLPYERTPYEALPAKHREETLDLAQCIFGYISKNKSLKGRVQFGYALSTNAQPDEDVTLILNSPKASYYPIYIRQSGNKGITTAYNTYNNGVPSGWKRYYIRKATWDKSMNNEKLDTVIHPIKAGAIFNCCITFHNLRSIELGALLSALTFHNTKNCYHSLGQAKPYGFGKTTYQITKLDCDNNNNDMEYYMACFEYAISKALSQQSFSGELQDWTNLKQIKELFAMSARQVAGKQFEYMSMDTKGINEFVEAKGDNRGIKPKEYLSPIKIMLGDDIKPVSLFQRGKEINKPIIEAKFQRIRDSYDKRFTELLNKPEADALIGFDKLIEDIGENEKTEIDNDIKEMLFSLKQELLNRKVELISKFEGDKNKQIFEKGISECLANLSSYGRWETLMKKWGKWCSEYDNGRSILTESEKNDALTQLASTFVNAKKADQKKFKWKEASKLLGMEVNATNITNYLKQ